jgi:hypothetical protein
MSKPAGTVRTVPPTPKPKTIKVVCDVCGQDWKAHGTKPTLEDCVRLLKAELRKRPPAQWQMSGTHITPLRQTA